MTEPKWKQWVKTANRKKAQAKFKTCSVCLQTIEMGDIIFPSDYGQWAHFACVTNENGIPRIPFCKHGANCKHPNCFFQHPPKTTETPSSPKISLKSSRSGVFRRWLLSTFGRQSLSKGSGLMEVAAGKGVLSFELLNVDQIPAFAFEPRDLELDKVTRRYDWGFYKRRADNTLTQDHLTPGTSIPPKHIRSMFEFQSQTKTHLPISLQSIDAFTKAESRRKELLKRYSSTDHHHEDMKMHTPKPYYTRKKIKQEIAGNVIDDVILAQKMVTNCSIVVGMHPDEATEAIIDFAMTNNKPFAVVPCCVHSKQFPTRRLIDENGDHIPVRNYDQFITYISRKHRLVQKENLPFEGRNTVLYHLGNYE